MGDDGSNGIKSDVATLNNNAVGGFNALVQIGIALLNRLDHIIHQNESILCNLRTSNDLACRRLQRLNVLRELAEHQSTSISHLDAVYELVHGTEAMMVERRGDELAKIERCCPAPQPKPESCPDACPEPNFLPVQPNLDSFKPVTIQVPETTK